MPEDDKVLLAAVDAAVTEETPPAANDPEIPADPPQEAANDPDIETPPAKEEPPDDKAPPVEEPPAKVDEPVKGAAPDKPADPPPEPVKAKKPEPPAKPDVLNDPIPDTVKGRTRERMEGLVSHAKSLDTQLTAAKRDLGELYSAIEETKAPPQQFAETLDALKGFNSSAADERRAAAKYFRGLADTIADELGDVVPGKNVLDAYPDLKQRVEERELSPELAQELAQARVRAAADERRTTQERERTKSQNEAARTKSAAVDRGRVELNTLGARLHAADPVGFAARNAVVLPKMQALRDKLDPAQWAPIYQMLYEAAAVPAPNGGTGTRPGRAPAGTGANQPMRPRATAGGGAVQEPKSALEAMELALRT